MAGNTTFMMIKPDAVSKGHLGAILTMVNKAGFRISAMKFIRISLEEAQAFYKVHEGRDFYERLINFMSSGPIVAAIIEKEDAVTEYRKLIGSTDPAKADEGTVRKLYGTNVALNAVHGSDSDANAQIESAFFFSALERF